LMHPSRKNHHRVYQTFLGTDEADYLSRALFGAQTDSSL